MNQKSASRTHFQAGGELAGCRRAGSQLRGNRLTGCLLAAGLLLAPQLAFACGLSLPNWLLPAVFGTAAVFGLATLPAFAVKWVWKIASGRTPALEVSSVSSALLAVLLGALGIFAIPRFDSLYASFGADLPALTRIVIDLHYLLVMPAVLLAFVAILIKDKARRRRWLDGFLVGNSALMFLTTGALYSPIFKMC